VIAETAFAASMLPERADGSQVASRIQECRHGGAAAEIGAATQPQACRFSGIADGLESRRTRFDSEELT
jgi:hypothetical protein